LDPLVLVGQLIGVSARVGAVFALAALILYVGRRAGVEFFTGLEPVLFNTMIVAGIIGACTVVVAVGRTFLLALLEIVNLWLRGYVGRQSSRRTALNNMTALKPEHTSLTASTAPRAGR
jgi:hypothetical protein